MKNSDENMSSQADCCEANVIHEDIVRQVEALLLPISLRGEMAEFYKIMGDSTRISILNALSHSEMCVCDIACLLQMSQSAISHQLKTLRQARLVSSRREGKVVYYSLDDDHVHQIIDLGRTHLAES